MSPALSIKAALYRAAMHAMPKGPDAPPALCGVRIERVQPCGVNIVATDGLEILIWLRDRDGFVGCDATIQLPSTFFETARRFQHDTGNRRSEAVLEINHGLARITPGGGPGWEAGETGLPFIDWRKLLPAKAARRFMPSISPDLQDRLNCATQILAGAGLVTKCQWACTEDGEAAVLSWGRDLGFGVINTAVAAEPMPWSAPFHSMLALPEEVRAS